MAARKVAAGAAATIAGIAGYVYTNNKYICFDFMCTLVELVKLSRTVASLKTFAGVTKRELRRRRRVQMEAMRRSTPAPPWTPGAWPQPRVDLRMMPRRRRSLKL